MNAATLNKPSMPVLLLKKPSQEKDVPQMNAARRSSVPRRVVRPTVSMARDKY